MFKNFTINKLLYYFFLMFVIFFYGYILYIFLIFNEKFIKFMDM